ncbi:MAG: hypothetical protein V3T86_01330 [Planctomycetota bacterium]
MNRPQRKIHALIPGATLAIALSALGCGGGGGGTTGDTGPGTPQGPSAALQAAGDCLGVGMEDVFEMFLGILDLAAAVDNPGAQPADVNYDPTGGGFTISLDLDGDGTPDAAINGTVTSTDNLGDGLDAGESFTMQWQLGGILNGAGQFTVTRDSATGFTVTGTGNVEDTVAACAIALGSMTVTLDNTQALPATVAGGSIAFTVDELTGTIAFTGAVTADVEGELVTTPVSFVLDLATFEPDFS